MAIKYIVYTEQEQPKHARNISKVTAPIINDIALTLPLIVETDITFGAAAVKLS